MLYKSFKQQSQQVAVISLMVHQPNTYIGLYLLVLRLDFQDYTHFIVVVNLLVKAKIYRVRTKDDYQFNIVTLRIWKGNTHYNHMPDKQQHRGW